MFAVKTGRKTVGRRFLWQTGVYGVGRFAGVGLSAALIPIYLRFLLPDAYSILIVAQALTPVLGSLLTFNFEAAGARFYFDYQGVERRRFMGSLFMFARVQSLVVAVAAWLTIPWWIGLLGNPLLAPHHVHLTLVSALGQSLVILPTLMLRMKEAPVAFVVLSFVPALVGAVLGVGLLTGTDLGVTAILIGQAVGSGVAVPIGLYLIRDEITPAWEGKYLRRAWRYLRPMLPEYFVGSLVSSLDRFVLGWYAPPEVVGQYGVAYQIGNIVRNILGAIKTAHTPMAFRLWREPAGADRAGIVKISNYMFAGVIAAVFSAAVGGAAVLTWFGREGHSSALTFVPLSLLPPIFTALYMIYSVSDLVRESPRACFWSWVISAAVTAASLFALVPAFQAIGAMAAVAIGQAVRALSVWILAERVMRIGFPDTRYLVLALGSTGVLALAAVGQVLAAFGLGGGLVGLTVAILLPREFLWLRNRIFSRGRPPASGVANGISP